MAAVNLGATLSAAIDDLKKDPGTHIVAVLLMLLVNAFSFSLLSGPMMVGYVKMMDKSRRGEPISAGDIFKGFDAFVPALVSSILGAIIVTVGSMLCIIPGLIVAPLIPLSAYLVAQGEQDGVNALQRGWEMLKGDLVMPAVTMLVLGLVAGVGAIACGIGVLVTAPIGILGGYHLARQLAE